MLVILVAQYDNGGRTMVMIMITSDCGSCSNVIMVTVW